MPHANEDFFEYQFNHQNGVLTHKNLMIAKNFAPAAHTFHIFGYIYVYLKGIKIRAQYISRGTIFRAPLVLESSKSSKMG